MKRDEGRTERPGLIDGISTERGRWSWRGGLFHGINIRGDHALAMSFDSARWAW